MQGVERRSEGEAERVAKGAAAAVGETDGAAVADADDIGLGEAMRGECRAEGAGEVGAALAPVEAGAGRGDATTRR